MDNFDFKDEQLVKRSGSQFSLWDMLSILVLVLTLCIGGYFALIFINPNTPLNPLPPPPTAFLFPTATITPIQQEATWTATVAITTPTGTLAPLITLEPSITPVLLVPPTKTPKPTSTPKAPYSASVTWIDSTIIHPDLGCNWFGIGGSVTNADNAPALFNFVRIGGTLNGQIYDPNHNLHVTGENKLYSSDASFEFVLGNKPVDSDGTLWIQLTKQDGTVLAGPIYLKTYSNCSKNLILVRFKENR